MTTRIRVEDATLRLGERFTVTFQRTLRVPVDDRTYPLPPGLGALPVRLAVALPGDLPTGWRETDALVPLYRREALWLGFGGAPHAVTVGAGGVNVVSGAPWQPRLADDPQDYLVTPLQPWLDGVNTGAGRVRQFVAMPLGPGDTIEEQLASASPTGGIRLRVCPPKPGRVPDEPPGAGGRGRAAPVPEMGLAAGGEIAQRVHPDPYGIDAWDQHAATEVTIHLVTSEGYRALTGEPPPPSPVTIEDYERFGLPWYQRYDEELGDLAPGAGFASLRPLAPDEDASDSIGEAFAGEHPPPVIDLHPCSDRPDPDPEDP